MQGLCGIILDLDMPIMGGLEACERIIKSYGDFDNMQSGSIIPICSRKSNGRHKEIMSPVRNDLENKKKRLNAGATKNARSMKVAAEAITKINKLHNSLLVHSYESEEIKDEPRLLDDSTQ